VDVIEAAKRFSTALSYCEDVIAVHRRAGTGLPGRRDEETTLNRAVVVMAAAAWQVAVENLVLSALDLSAVHAAAHPPATLAAYDGTVRGWVRRFSTPNSRGSRELLRAVGYDPAGEWSTYTVPGRPASGTLETQLDSWLKVRHAIAHADEFLPAEHVLQHVRQYEARHSGAVPASPGLRLPDAESCVKFVRRITTVTGDGMCRHLSVPTVPWK